MYDVIILTLYASFLGRNTSAGMARKIITFMWRHIGIKCFDKNSQVVFAMKGGVLRCYTLKTAGGPIAFTSGL